MVLDAYLRERRLMLSDCIRTGTQCLVFTICFFGNNNLLFKMFVNVRF